MVPRPAFRPAAPNAWQRRLQGLAAIGPVTRAVAPLIHVADLVLLRLTGDRLSLTSLAIGLPVKLISTTGARTGRVRTHPLTTVPDGSGLGLIASNFGRRRLPGWSHNLRARGAADVRLNGAWRTFRAVEVTGEERRRLWEQAVFLYPGYADYARRAAPRPIPVFLLVPAEETA
jgi:deazaflavin-dependent oxidoreductase (nitroreductase family)